MTNYYCFSRNFNYLFLLLTKKKSNNDNDVVHDDDHDTQRQRRAASVWNEELLAYLSSPSVVCTLPNVLRGCLEAL